METLERGRWTPGLGWGNGKKGSGVPKGRRGGGDLK